MPRSFIGLYWKIWFGLVASLLTLRVTLFDRLAEKEQAWLFFGYAAPAWIGVMIANFFEGQRLMGHLESNHRSKWEELTYVPFFGSGGGNGFRTMAFVRSNDDLNDPLVAALKRNYRRMSSLAMVVFISMIPLFLAVMLPWESFLAH